MNIKIDHKKIPEKDKIVMAIHKWGLGAGLRLAALHNKEKFFGLRIPVIFTTDMIIQAVINELSYRVRGYKTFLFEEIEIDDQFTDKAKTPDYLDIYVKYKAEIPCPTTSDIG